MDQGQNDFGKVVILNGTSSSGKSKLAKALQHRLEGTYLHCSLDAFWNMTPSDIPANSINFPNLKSAMVQSIGFLARTGHNVIVDIIYSGEDTHRQMTHALKDVHMTTVKVECPSAELRRRELKRGDRKIGLAESQISSVHQNVCYDLVLDTSKASPEACADIISDSIG